MRIKLAGAVALALLSGAALGQAPVATTARPIPAIVAPTPTAPFSATSGRLTFDRACRSFTAATVAGDPACAPRVARGETGPTLEVAMATLQADRSPAAFAAAIALIERAIAAENHPAAHYLAGSLLTTGEIALPDWRRGIPHLERAAAGGNAAAADLLAAHLIVGRGARQDVGRAISLYEQAAAGGMDGAATRLAIVYLTDRFVPRDVERGRRILEAAAAAGVRDARPMLSALEAEPMTRNYQLHPDADPAKVEVRQYPTLANPEVPPAFGFTDEFRRVHYSDLSDPAVIERLERDHASLPTPWLFELARRLAPVDPGRARGWMVLARLRLGYDVLRCAEPQVREAVGAWERLVAPELRPVLAHASAEEHRAARMFALEREAALPGDTRPWWVCHGGLSGFAGVADGPPQLRLTPEREWPGVRARLRELIRNAPFAAAQ